MTLADTAAAAASVGRPAATIRTWAARGLLTRRGKDWQRRTLYDLDEVAATNAQCIKQEIAMVTPETNPEQLAAVLEQIASYSSPADIRAHVLKVAEALRGSGLVILNGPPQEAMRQEAMRNAGHASELDKRS